MDDFRDAIDPKYCFKVPDKCCALSNLKKELEDFSSMQNAQNVPVIEAAVSHLFFVN
jgi:hypothetical protein